MAETEEKCPICGGNYMQSYPSPLIGRRLSILLCNVLSCFIYVLYMFYVSFMYLLCIFYVLCIVVIRPLVR